MTFLKRPSASSIQLHWLLQYSKYRLFRVSPFCSSSLLDIYTTMSAITRLRVMLSIGATSAALIGISNLPVTRDFLSMLMCRVTTCLDCGSRMPSCVYFTTTRTRVVVQRARNPLRHDMDMYHFRVLLLTAPLA